MSKLIKEMIVSDVRDRIGEQREMLVVDSSRVDAITDNKMRLSLREKNITILRVKNSLARRALHSAGVSALDSLLQGPSSLVWGGEDIVALAKEMAKWAKDVAELDIKGGTTEGTTLSADDVKSLSKSPGRVELIGRSIALALSPGGNIAGALLGPGGTLAGQIKGKSEE